MTDQACSARQPSGPVRAAGPRNRGANLPLASDDQSARDPDPKPRNIGRIERIETAVGALIALTLCLTAGCGQSDGRGPTQPADPAIAVGESDTSMKAAKVDGTTPESGQPTPSTPEPGSSGNRASESATEELLPNVASSGNGPLYPQEATDLHNQGVRYWIGDGVAKDSAQAAELFRQAADLNHPGSQHNLAVLYWHGDGVEQNYTQARVWLTKASTAGLPEAQFKLSTIYALGLDTPQDMAIAASWLKRAAEAGLAEAQSNLATLYIRGEGVGTNIVEAIKWYRHAAEQGVASTQSNLGVFYASGNGVEQNLEEAKSWFQKAADQYHPTALYNLGGLYMEGKVVEQDFQKAYHYLALASTMGDPDARIELQSLISQMDPLELAKSVRKFESHKRSIYEELQEHLAREEASRTNQVASPYSPDIGSETAPNPDLPGTIGLDSLQTPITPQP